jgi:hypothetical protein
LLLQYGYRAAFSAAGAGNRIYTFCTSIGGPDTDAMGGVGGGAAAIDYTTYMTFMNVYYIHRLGVGGRGRREKKKVEMYRVCIHLHIHIHMIVTKYAWYMMDLPTTFCVYIAISYPNVHICKYSATLLVYTTYILSIVHILLCLLPDMFPLYATIYFCCLH